MVDVWISTYRPQAWAKCVSRLRIEEFVRSVKYGNKSVLNEKLISFPFHTHTHTQVKLEEKGWSFVDIFAKLRGPPVTQNLENTPYTDAT